MVSLFAGLLFSLLLGLAYFLAQPRWLLNLAARFKPGAIYAVTFPANVPWVVALTIDDGPSAATADILAVLARYDAKATFFNISGHLPGYEAVVAEAIAAHHELGNHLTADEPSIRLSPEAFEADLLTAEQAWQPYVSPDPLRWLRPGMGFYSASMVATAQRHGYQLALGSVFPYDTHVPFSGFAIAFILSTVQPGDIIVLHDGKERGQRTVNTLKKILPALQARGYTVTTLTNLIRAAECIGYY
jgi:peptidoglycan-N-acetylglucosamine deacetylase